jgi:tetratricopeptide (TPR) repeat protein
VTAAIGRIQWSALVEGRRAEAVALLQGAAACFGTDTTTGAELQAHQAWILLWLDGDPQACRLANEAAPVLRAAGHSRGLAMCLRTLGHAARRACQPTLAARHFEDALDLPEVDGGPSLRATLHDALGMALLQAGDIDAARVQFEQALALNLACGDEVQRMYNHLNLADAHACAGQPARALPMARAALAIGSACGFPLMLPYVQAQLARVWVALGRQPEGLLAAGQAVARAHETGDASALACALDAQARAALLGGDVAAARQTLRDAVRWALRTRNLALGPLLLSTARQAFADLALASGWSQLAAPHLLAQVGADLEVDPDDPVEPGA